jgi:putative acetyltransferase
MDTFSFVVRRAGPTDADEIAVAHLHSIHTLGASAYAPDVVAVWGAPRDGARYRQSIENGELFFVAVAPDTPGERVLGFSTYRVEDGKHRTAIYVRGDAARAGVGTALFQTAEAAAREHGATEIHVDASLAAIGFYESQGFEQLAAGQHQLRDGVVMDCILMRKRL